MAKVLHIRQEIFARYTKLSEYKEYCKKTYTLIHHPDLGHHQIDSYTASYSLTIFLY